MCQGFKAVLKKLVVSICIKIRGNWQKNASFNPSGAVAPNPDQAKPA